MNVELRKATENDLGFIWKLYSSSVGQLMGDKIVGGWNDEVEKLKFRKIFSLANTEIIIVSGETVGWIDYRKEGSTVKLINGYIIPEKRRKGIGKEVVKKVRVGSSEVVTSTIANSPSKEFFTQQGFKEEKQDGEFVQLKLT